jgi:hypothetical protein
MSAAPETPPGTPPDPAHRKSGVRVATPAAGTPAAGGSRDGLAGRLTALLSEFRAQNRFFKWRVAVIAGWVVLGLVSVAFGLSGGERNPIGATVRVVTTGLGPAVHVRNDSRHPWQDVRLVLPGGWTHERATVRPDDSFSVAIAEFSRTGEGGAVEHAPRDLVPTRVTVHTRTGRYEADASRR